MIDKQPGAPWWIVLIPDTRAWIAAGFFALTGYVLHLLATTPNLGESKLFFALAEAIIITGLIGGVVAFYYSASKSHAAPPSAEAPGRPLAPPPDPAAPPAPPAE